MMRVTLRTPSAGATGSIACAGPRAGRAGPRIPNEVLPMKVAVVRETAPGERRVALVPDAVAKLQKAGYEVLVESGAGDGAWLTDDSFAEAGASIVSRADALSAADVVLGVGKPDAATLAALHKGQAVFGLLAPLHRPRPGREPGRRRAHRGQPGHDPAHAAPRPVHGRAQLPGQHRRLQGGAAGGGGVRPVLPAADHRGGHGPAGQGPGPGHRRGRPAGHRHRPPARRRGQRLRRAARDPDRGRVAGRHVHRADVGRPGLGHRRLRPGADPGGARRPSRTSSPATSRPTTW